VRVADPPPLLFCRSYCSEWLMLILLRGVACHVRRPIALRVTLSVNAGRDVSKSTSHFVGSPAFRLKNMPGIVFSA
jgi:hypothetical protein